MKLLFIYLRVLYLSCPLARFSLKKKRHITSFLPSRLVFTSHSFSLFLLLTHFLLFLPNSPHSTPSPSFSLFSSFLLNLFPSFLFFLPFSPFFALLLFLSPPFSSLQFFTIYNQNNSFSFYSSFFISLIFPPWYIFLIFHTFFPFLSLPPSLALPFLPNLFFSYLFYFMLYSRYLRSFCLSFSCFLFYYVDNVFVNYTTWTLHSILACSENLIYLSKVQFLPTFYCPTMPDNFYPPLLGS